MSRRRRFRERTGEVLANAKSVFRPLEEYPAAIAFHLYLESCRCPRAIIRSHRRRRASARCSLTPPWWKRRKFRHGIYRGVCSNISPTPRRDIVHATVKETKAGFRLPDDTPVLSS